MVVKHRVAVLLADPGRAVQMADALEKQNLDVILATGSDELYQAFNRSPIDLIVIEHRLGGFLTGLEILERLFSDLLRPATVIFGDLSKEEMRRVEAIGVQRVLESSASNAQAAEVVGQMIRQLAHREEVISPTARRIVQRADYIQPLPQLLVQLVGHLREDEIDTPRLVGDISVDPLIAADLLKYANSSAVGRRQRTTKISDAVNYLGPRRAVSVAISTGMMRARGALLGDLPQAVHHWHSSRAVLTACTAACFAGRMENISEESAYILGLIQDLGILVMARAFGERYIESLHRVRRIAHLNLPHVEQDCFGATHAEVSAALLRKWELPGSFVSLVLRHHDRDGHDRADVDERFLRTMQIGEAFSDLHDNRSPQRYLALRKLLDQYGARAAAECRDCLSEAVAKTAESSEVFQIPAPNGESLQSMLQELMRKQKISGPAVGEAAVETPSAPVHPPDAFAPATTTILVIDDEPSVAKMIALYLRDWNCRILTCDTLVDGRRLAEDADLVLCDVHLGGENGIDLVRELRSEGYAGPITIISGDGLRSTVLDSIEAGVNDYLLKPFSKAQLIDKIRKHLRVPAPAC